MNQCFMAKSIFWIKKYQNLKSDACCPAGHILINRVRIEQRKPWKEPKTQNFFHNGNIIPGRQPPNVYVTMWAIPLVRVGFFCCCCLIHLQNITTASCAVPPHLLVRLYLWVPEEGHGGSREEGAVCDPRLVGKVIRVLCKKEGGGGRKKWTFENFVI